MVPKPEKTCEGSPFFSRRWNKKIREAIGYNRSIRE